MALLNRQVRHLKALAHKKNPVVTIGNNGLSESVITEIMAALSHHELIKVKLPAAQRKDREHLSHEVCERCNAEFVTLIGRVLVIFSPAPDTAIQFPS